MNIKIQKTVSFGSFRVVTLALLFFILTPVLSMAQAGKVNFSGTWTLNNDKSELGDHGGRRMGGGDFKVTQESNFLTVERTFTNRDGQLMSSTMKYTLDGKESVNSSRFGDSKSTAKWSADGKTLTIKTTRNFEYNGNSRTMKSSEVWSLDGKNMVIKSARDGRNGEVKTKMVYDKK